MGTALDKPLYYVNSMRILARKGLRVHTNFTLTYSELVTKPKEEQAKFGRVDE